MFASHIVYPSIGGIARHVQIDIVRIKPCRFRETAFSLIVIKAGYTIRLVKVPYRRYSNITEVTLIQHVVGFHYDISGQRILHDKNGVRSVVYQVSLTITSSKICHGIAKSTQFIKLMAIEIRAHIDNTIRIGILHERRSLENELEVLHIAGFNLIIVQYRL